MAFVYEAGTASDVADWFTKLEAFLISAGWTVESGSGTQTVVFKSLGEGGGRTKLHIRFRQDSGSPQYVWHRVQDDVAGTHATTEALLISGRLDAGGAGAAPFDYWMIADKDCAIVMFVTGGAYSGTYTGIIERFAVSISDEEKEMVAIKLHNQAAWNCGAALMKHDGTWGIDLFDVQMTEDADKNPIDDSYPLFGFYVTEANTPTNNTHLGQLKHVSNRMVGYAGLNALDTIATGFGGASSLWMVFGTGVERWAIHISGALPVGAWEGGFSYTSGVATDINDLNTKFKAFLATHGWSVVVNPSPSWPIDYFLNSSGQLAGDDIWLHWRYDTAQSLWGGRAMDDAGMGHVTGYSFVGTPTHPWLYSGDFPVNYFIAGDGDCFVHGVEVASIWGWAWFGMYTPYVPDPSVFSTPYKVGNFDLTARYVLRQFNGSWGGNPTIWGDRYGNSSPNLLDGTTYLIWPYPLYEGIILVGSFALGQPKYVHRLSGPALAVNDTVTIGGRRYVYLGGAGATAHFAVRDQ